MPEKDSAGGPVANGLKSIFDRVGEFFHIFDISFFVSGVMALGALSFLFILMGNSWKAPLDPWVRVIAFVVTSYILGLLSFAAGRELSGRTFRRNVLPVTLTRAVRSHNIEVGYIRSYMTTLSPDLWRLYIRMWSDISRQNAEPTVLHHLMRYWVMAATYDGVGFSLLIWAAVLIVGQIGYCVDTPIGHGKAMMGALMCVGASVLAFRRGANYYEYQIEDVVAYFAGNPALALQPSAVSPAP